MTRGGVARAVLRLAVLALVAGLLLFAAGQRLLPLDLWWLELGRYLPFPAALAAALAALLLSCWLGARWRVASAAALLAVATAGMGWEWHLPDAGEGGLRVMTYNVKIYDAARRAEGLAGLEREVSRHRPDLLVMQDADGLLPPGASASLGPLFGLPEVRAFGQYVVASRFPLRDCRPGRIEIRGEGQSYLRCRVAVGEQELTLVTAHLETPRRGLDAARREGLAGLAGWRQNYRARLQQARTLARDLASEPGPLIVAGDLNAAQSSPVVAALLSAGLRDAFGSAGRGYGYTYGHALPLGFSFLRIDHVLVSRQLGVQACFAGGAEASEHRPVIADLLLRRR